MVAKTNGKFIETAERRAFVLDCRRSGMKYADIAEATAEKFGIDNLPKGWDSRYAYKDVKREMDKLRDQMAEDVEDIRQMEIDRLDDMLAGLWEDAKDGKPQAVDRVLKIMSRRSKLVGLDAPTQISSIVRNIDLEKLSDDQLERLADGEDIISVIAG